MTEGVETFVPVERASLLALGREAAAARRARAAEREAVEGLLELADELLADVVRRLRERGATEAQVAARVEGLRARVAALRRAALEADAARERLERRAQELAEV